MRSEFFVIAGALGTADSFLTRICFIFLPYSFLTSTISYATLKTETLPCDAALCAANLASYFWWSIASEVFSFFVLS